VLCQYLTVSEKAIKNLTINYISCADERLIGISNLLHGTPDGQGADSKPHAPSPKLGAAV